MTHYRRVRPLDLFSDGKHSAKHSCNAWNARYADAEAFTSLSAQGYLVGNIFGRLYRSHRVIWALETGAWPVDQIDHKDHDRTNNRFVNLREVTNHENGKNKSMGSNNVSGVVGVSWFKQTGKWVAKIKVAGKSKHLGYFANIESATAARANASLKYNFHANHGVSAG